jgi:hypothetical protein
MAYAVVSKTNNGLGDYIVVFLAETILDVADITTEVAVGSVILCQENNKKYILSTDKVWTIQ